MAAFAIDVKRNREATKNLDPAWVIKPLVLGKAANCEYEVVADSGMTPLSDFMLFAGPMGIESILVLTVSMAKALDAIHSAGIIHRNINPACIWSDSSLTRVVFSDFSRSVHLSEAVEASRAVPLLDTRFLAPEQMGPFLSLVDGRADLYAVGAVAYSLLCGSAPIQDAVPLDRTGTPAAARLLKGDVPEGLSAVVMKLLSQDPQQRYQTTKGALHDLSYCLEQLRASGRVDTFALGSRDAAPGFDIPDKLFGRENELRQLVEALVRVRAGASELVLISGPAGIGKSKLASHNVSTGTERFYFGRTELNSYISVSAAAIGGLPVLASALSYFDSYRRGTANVIEEAQRDFFGRVDSTDSHHGPWDGA
ncbi:serine/threonine protein kinase [Sinorhizobium chiapasense]|uniref:AAA family ATPase n=1 Tax=Sinorhizobium chiapasense TaxID=501572 RepID=A0ABZ2BIK5_9HYPH